MAALARASSNSKRQTHLSLERMLHKDYDRKGFRWGGGVVGRVFQGAWLQGELIEGKPPV